jgi:hypothetical protein
VQHHRIVLPRLFAALAGAALVLVTASCGSAPAAPKPTQASKPTVEASAPKPAVQRSPTPSPAPDPAGRTEPVDGACPPSHQIKGVTSPEGRKLYYEPERPPYASIVPETCFTAGPDARGAGYVDYRR